jgi:hypothetical protein
MVKEWLEKQTYSSLLAYARRSYIDPLLVSLRSIQRLIIKGGVAKDQLQANLILRQSRK